VFWRGDDGHPSFYLLSGDAAQSNLARSNGNKFFNLSENGQPQLRILFVVGINGRTL
jgi:hypothetical protein